MEQRKRDSEVPVGTFDVGQVSDADERGDLSGTFLRPVSEIPPAPVARIELRRRAAVRPAMPSLRPVPSLLPAMPSAAPHVSSIARSLPPPPPPAAFKVAPALPALTVPTTTPEPMSLRALVAPSYPPPPTLAESERVDFSQFAQRLDVHALPPPPASLLPPAESTRRPSRMWALALLLIAVGAGGWYARGITTIVATKPVTKAAPVRPVVAPVVQAPAVAAPVVQAPVVAEVVVAEAVVAPIDVAPVVAAPVVPVIKSPALKATSVAAAPIAVEPVATLEAEPSVVVASEGEALEGEALEGEALEGEHAPSLEEAIVEELPETLAREEVIEGIELLRNEYQTCAGDLHGTAEIRLTIANTGRITHALVGGHFAGTPQGSCLARTLRQARFREFQQPRLDITYPIAL